MSAKDSDRVAAAAPAVTLAPAATARTAHDQPHPLVIGHRGAAGYLPDHTLAAYALAIKLGADFIEPDLVSTKDGRLIARHEANITATTDVAAHPEFADRKRTAVRSTASPRRAGSPPTSRWRRSGRCAPCSLWPRARSPVQRPASAIPTLRGSDRARQALLEAATAARSAIYPETKHPTYHQSMGLPLEQKLVRVARPRGLEPSRSPVFIQSFEVGNLKQLNKPHVGEAGPVDRRQRRQPGRLARLHRPVRPALRLDRVRAPELLARTFGDLTDERRPGRGGGLRGRHRPVEAVHHQHGRRGHQRRRHGRRRERRRPGRRGRPQGARADRAGRARTRARVVVHPYTFRNEAKRLAFDYGGNPVESTCASTRRAWTGCSPTSPDTAFAARELFWLQNSGWTEEDAD